MVELVGIELLRRNEKTLAFDIDRHVVDAALYVGQFDRLIQPQRLIFGAPRQNSRCNEQSEQTHFKPLFSASQSYCFRKQSSLRLAARTDVAIVAAG